MSIRRKRLNFRIEADLEDYLQVHLGGAALLPTFDGGLSVFAPPL